MLISNSGNDLSVFYLLLLASIFPALSPDSKYVFRKRKRANTVSSCASFCKFALAVRSKFLRSKLDGSRICSSSRVLSSKFNFDFISLRFLFSPEEKLIKQPLHVALKASQTVAILDTEYKFIIIIILSLMGSVQFSFLSK